MTALRILHDPYLSEVYVVEKIDQRAPADGFDELILVLRVIARHQRQDRLDIRQRRHPESHVKAS